METIPAQTHPAMRPTRCRADKFLLLFTACVLLPACQRAPELETWPLHGTVVDQDGTPLTGGVVRLLTEADSYLITVGPIQSDGSFTVRTQRQGFPYDGAVAGEYQVLVITAKTGPDGNPAPFRYLLPESYTVQAGDNEFALEIRR